MKRPRAPRRALVEAPRHLLLAGARLAGDQHRHVGRRRARHLLVDLEQRRAPAHQLLRFTCCAEALVLLHQPLLLERPPDHPDDGVDVEGLGQVVEGALLDGVQRALDVAEGGEHDDRRVRRSWPAPRCSTWSPSSGSGIAMSVSTRSTGPVPSRSSSRRRRGRWPRTPPPAGRAAAAAGPRACGSSSTTRMPGRLIAPTPARRARACAARAASVRGRSTRRKAHRRAWCRSPACCGRASVPPCASTSRLVVASPSPWPGSPRASGARKNGWNSRPSIASVIPGPLSVTSSTASSPRGRRTPPPARPAAPAEYFTALEMQVLGDDWTSCAGTSTPTCRLELPLDAPPRSARRPGPARAGWCSPRCPARTAGPRSACRRGRSGAAPRPARPSASRSTRRRRASPSRPGPSPTPSGG